MSKLRKILAGVLGVAMAAALAGCDEEAPAAGGSSAANPGRRPARSSRRWQTQLLHRSYPDFYRRILVFESSAVFSCKKSCYSLFFLEKNKNSYCN